MSFIVVKKMFRISKPRMVNYRNTNCYDGDTFREVLFSELSRL